MGAVTRANNARWFVGRDSDDKHQIVLILAQSRLRERRAERAHDRGNRVAMTDNEYRLTRVLPKNEIRHLDRVMVACVRNDFRCYPESSGQRLDR